MRVVAGRHGGRRLQAPAGRTTRPTGDRVREALFSSLADVTGSTVLDLFAGSGALGIEALSRGAASATFVDRAPPAIRAVQANLAALGLEAEVRCQDARSFLRNAGREGRQYDLVFVDPPYRRGAVLAGELGPLLGPVFAERARVVVESDRRVPLRLTLDVELLEERCYGDTLIHIHGPR